MFKVCGGFATDEFKITICNHFKWKFTYVFDESFELWYDGVVFEIGKRVDEFETSFSVNYEKAVSDFSDACAGAVANVVVEDISEVLWAFCWCCVVVFLG